MESDTSLPVARSLSMLTEEVAGDGADMLTGGMETPRLGTSRSAARPASRCKVLVVKTWIRMDEFVTSTEARSSQVEVLAGAAR